MATAVVLVVCAGLCLRTINNLHAVESGFDRKNVLMVHMRSGDAGYPLPRGGDVGEEEVKSARARLLGMLSRVIARVEAVPGVVSVAKSECGFLSGCSSSRSRLVVVGGSPEPSDVNVRYEQVWPSYVETMGMALLMGRDLSERDGPDAPAVALVNETMARTFFGDEDPVGRAFRWEGGSMTTEIVGVVRDVNPVGPRARVSPYIYYPHAQNPSDSVALSIKTAVPPGTLAGAVRAALSEVEARISMLSMTTLDEQFDVVIRRELLLGRLTAAFGLLALVLTCVGLYGLLAYSVARRTNEIGLRMALGAQRWGIVAEVLRSTMGLVAFGLGVGLLGALGLARLLTEQLFEVGPGDPLTIAGAVGLVLAVAVLAAGLPARRASRVEPMDALRYE